MLQSFIKHIPSLVIFMFSWSLLFLLAGLYLERLGIEGSPLIYIFILLGGLVGILMHRRWLDAKGWLRSFLFGVTLVLFCFFGALVGMGTGADLGGNGILVMEWGGLHGYESVGLLFGVVGSFLGAIFGYAGLRKSVSVMGLLLAIIGLGLELLLSSYQGWRFNPLFSLLPLLGLVGANWGPWEKCQKNIEAVFCPFNW